MAAQNKDSILILWVAVNGGVGDGTQARSAGSVSVITAGSVSAYRGRGERGVRYRVIKGWVSGQQWIYFH